VLFATYSCVDNTESDSVANLRNAKADELKANAQALKDHASADLARAQGEKTLNEAKAQTEAAIAKYQEAQAEYYLLLGEAAVLQAEGEKALNEGRGKYYEGQAEYQLALAEEKRIEADHTAAMNAQALRAEMARVDSLLAGQADRVRAAELTAKKLMLDAQITVLQAAADLNLEAAVKYGELVQKVYEALKDQTTEQGKIDDAKIKIEEQRLLLASFAVDSAIFVEKFIKSTEAEIAAKKLEIKAEEYNLLVANLDDAGLQDLKDALEGLVKDTVDARKAVDAALAEAATLAADTVAKYTAKEAANTAKETANTARETALAAWEAALETVAAKEKALEDYNKLAAPANFTFKKDDEVTGNVSGTRDNVLGYTINGKTYQLVDLEKSAPDYYVLRDSSDFKLTLDILRENANGTKYKWTYYVFEEISSPGYDTYPSEAVVELEIKYLKDDTTILQKALKDARKAVENARDSLAIFADSLYYAEKDSIAAAKSEIAARADTVVSSAAWLAAQGTFNAISPAIPTTNDSIALENAAKNHNWVHPFPTPPIARPFTGTNNSKVRLHELAKATLTLASNAFGGALTGYNYYKSHTLENAIDTVLKAEENLLLKTATLQQKEALALLLKGGKREELTLAIDAAKEAVKAPVAAYSAALTAYQAADAKYKDALKEYDDAIDSLNVVIAPTTGSLDRAEAALKSAIESYLDLTIGKLYYEFWIALGGSQTGITDKEADIALYNDKIAQLNVEIAEKEAQLANVTAHAPNPGSSWTGGTVAVIIENINKNIAVLEAEIVTATQNRDKAAQKATYYQAALDAFIETLETLEGE
jgi:hypothetical protein